MYTRSASFRLNAGFELLFGGGRAFRRNTVTSLRKPDACRTLAGREGVRESFHRQRLIAAERSRRSDGET